MWRMRLVLLLVLLVTLPGLGIALASTGVGPQRTGAPQSSSTAPSNLSSIAPEPVAGAVRTRAAEPDAKLTTSTRRKAPRRPASTAPDRTGPTAVRTSGQTRTPIPPGRGGAGSGSLRFGVTHHGVATFYAADGSGNCSFPAVKAGATLLVAAMNEQDYAGSAACGAYVSVRASNGRQVTVRVTDRCPECPPGAVDLSREAFVRLAPAVQGRIDVTWHLLSPALPGPISYVYKEGSSRYWCAVQVRNHRNPIATLQTRAGGAWKTLPRAGYNYFESVTGAGCGGTIRVTDIYGNRLTDTGIEIAPGAVQGGHSQLPAR